MSSQSLSTRTRCAIRAALLTRAALQLVLALAGVGLDGLHEAEARGLDRGDGVVLLLHGVLVLLLEALDEGLEVALGSLGLGLLLLDGGVEVVGGSYIPDLVLCLFSPDTSNAYGIFNYPVGRDDCPT